MKVNPVSVIIASNGQSSRLVVVALPAALPRLRLPGAASSVSTAPRPLPVDKASFIRKAKLS